MKSRKPDGEDSEASPARPEPRKEPQSKPLVIPAIPTGPGAAGVNLPGFLAPTKAFQVQSVPKTVKQVMLTDEELLKQEEEKREHIASIRRKFKEQHKKTLASLVNKNKEGEKKVTRYVYCCYMMSPF